MSQSSARIPTQGPGWWEMGAWRAVVAGAGAGAVTGAPTGVPAKVASSHTDSGTILLIS